MSGFSNPIANRIGELIRQALQSDNFVAGTSGWIIRKDGTAEFNNTTIRGSLLVSDPDGSFVHVFDEEPGQGAVIDIRPADTVAGVLTPARLIGQLNGSNRPYLLLQSAQLNGAGSSQIQLYADELGNRIITLIGQLTQVDTPMDVTGDVNLFGNSLNFDQGGRIFNTVPSPSGQRFPMLGKNIVAVLYFTGGGGPTSVAGAEAALAAWDAANTAPDFTAENNHMYSAEISGGISSTVAAAAELTTIRLRKTVNVVGSQFLGLVRAQPVSGGNVAPFWGKVWFRNASGANVAVPNLGLTVQRAAGTGNHSLFGDSATAGAVGPLKIIVRDEGLYADHDFTNGAAICTSIV